VAASTLERPEDLQSIRDLNNRYVLRQVIERYLRAQLVEGIENSSMFEVAIEAMVELLISPTANAGESHSLNVSNGGTVVEAFLEEYRKRQNDISSSMLQKSYIEWKVMTKPGEPQYESDEVKIDGIKWRFIAEYDRDLGSLRFYVR
jgi:hypothetical protein